MSVLVNVLLLLILIVLIVYEVMILNEFIRLHRGEVPFVPSTAAVLRVVVEADIFPKHGMILDLGCGDGRALRAFADAGHVGPLIGYERAPYPWVLARLRCAGRASIAIRWASCAEAPLEQARGVYLFLLTDAVQTLAPALASRLPPGTPVVSAEFAIPGWTPERVLVAKGVTAKEARIFVYRIS